MAFCNSPNSSSQTHPLPLYPNTISSTFPSFTPLLHCRDGKPLPSFFSTVYSYTSCSTHPKCYLCEDSINPQYLSISQHLSQWLAIMSPDCTVSIYKARTVVLRILVYPAHRGFPGGTSGKEPMCQCRRHKRRGFYPWVGKISWRKKWQPIPVFLPGKSHGQRSLMGYSPQQHKRVSHNLSTKQQHTQPTGQSLTKE